MEVLGPERVEGRDISFQSRSDRGKQTSAALRFKKMYIYIYISGLNENNGYTGSNVISTVKLKQTGLEGQGTL